MLCYTQHRHCSIRNTQWYVATQLNAKRKFTTHWYTITTVHNIRSGAQHMHDTETFELPEGQVASTINFV